MPPSAAPPSWRVINLVDSVCAKSSGCRAGSHARVLLVRALRRATITRAGCVTIRLNVRSLHRLVPRLRGALSWPEDTDFTSAARVREGDRHEAALGDRLGARGPDQ
jgi:hypothetical protein